MSAELPDGVAALIRRQQSTTARLRAGLPELLAELESLEEPALDLFEDTPIDQAERDRGA